MMAQRVLVMNQTRESVLSIGAEVADGILSRWGGLTPGRCLRPGGGLWLNAARLMHTVGVTSPIDVICLSRSRRVVEIQEDFRPFHVKLLGDHITSLLELPAQTVRESKTEIGDEVEITPSKPLQQVVALYTNGGPVEPHCVAKISHRRALLKTEDRWYPGTVIDMTLRYDDQYAKLAKMGEAANDSVTVRAKVLRPSKDGVEVEFVFLKRPDKRDLKRFVRRV